jgi:hypothetical protein
VALFCEKQRHRLQVRMLSTFLNTDFCTSSWAMTAFRYRRAIYQFFRPSLPARAVAFLAGGFSSLPISPSAPDFSSG